MHYRRFGKTEEELSVITLGGMRYKHGWDGDRYDLPDDSLQNCLEITEKALSIGINHIETAQGYNKSEALYGAILPKLSVKRDQYYLMTKGCTETYDDMCRMVETQLKDLKTDYFDFYGFHGINNREILNSAMKKNGPLDALEKYRDEGVIKHVGFSSHAPLDVIMDGINSDRFEFVNLHYYYFFQKNHPAVELAKHKDMGVFIISPNDKGGQLWASSNTVKEACTPLSPIQFNARYCLSNPSIHTLSFGFSELEHFPGVEELFQSPIVENAYGGTFDRKLLHSMNALDQTIGDTKCIQCDKCLPCPENIHIPEILRFRNMHEGYDMGHFGKYRYNMFESEGHWFPGNFATKCTDCGDCNPRCPVGLDIPTLIREAHDAFYIPKEEKK